ncbi:MAG: hypothetical protein MUD01_28435, partial [Chloroflexaceae bacterium]|nr:hypothetical protein [Chloroflexaceae bacterium]
EPAGAARRNLTVLLNQLRRALPAPEAVQTLGDSIALDPTHLQSDGPTLAAELPLAIVNQQYDHVAALLSRYRGPFLDGFTLPTSPEFEHWIEQERQAWERRYLDALAALVAGASQQGDYAVAIAAAHQALATDELAEDMHRQLIELYAASGDRSAALRQFERCCVVLERELGVGPLPETQAVYEAVRDGSFGLVARAVGEPDAWPRPTILQLAPPRACMQPIETATNLPQLPALAAPLIGRENELSVVTNLLNQGQRLISITGPGGSGKTHFALQLAWRSYTNFADGAVFVALAPLHDAAQVPAAIAQGLGIQQRGDLPLVTALRSYLHEKQLLLVLDNIEHLPGAIPLVGELLAAAPGLHILVTSRVVLRLQGEQLFSLPPLPCPDLANMPPLETLAHIPAMALLVARTQALNPVFQLSSENATALASICIHLDGLPLALELAAARLTMLSPQALLRRLDHRLALLTNGSRDLPDRQQTLRATIDWSYRLLDLRQRMVFEQLAVFAGGWTLEDAEILDQAIATGTAASQQDSLLDTLTTLVQNHLIQQQLDANDEPRFTMLETLREYALERLNERGTHSVVAQAHAHYFAAHIEWLADQLKGPAAARWFARLDADYPNIQVALAWLALHGKHELLLRCIVGLGHFWNVRGYIHEGCQWIERTLPLLAHTELAGIESASIPLRARAYATAAQLMILQGDYGSARAYQGLAVALWRERGDERALTLAMLIFSATYRLSGESDMAWQIFVEAAKQAEQLGDPEVLAKLAVYRARQARHQGDAQAARTWFEQALAHYHQRGDQWGKTHIQLDVLPMLLALNEVETAQRYADEVLAFAQALNSWTLLADVLNDLGEIARFRQDYGVAAHHYQASLRHYRQMGNNANVARLLHNLAFVALRQGDVSHARNLFIDALHMFERHGVERGIPEALAGLASLAAVQNQPLRAAHLWGAA